jgi:hypothetical protein
MYICISSLTLYLLLMKNLNSHNKVNMKKQTPVVAMAAKFLPDNSHVSGDFIKSYWPERLNKYIIQTCILVENAKNHHELASVSEWVIG